MRHFLRSAGPPAPKEMGRPHWASHAVVVLAESLASARLGQSEESGSTIMPVAVTNCDVSP